MSEIKIPEQIAKEILVNYDGFNNQILEWKSKITNLNIKFKLTRTQADYVIKYHNIKPKVARKFLEISSSFGEKLGQQRGQIKPVTQIWCEKLLCESDMAYHIYGKEIETDKFFKVFWLPKAAVIPQEKKLKEPIDFSKYDFRPPLEHQKTAVEKLLCNDRFILADDMGLGKGLLKSTIIYTPFGKTTMGQLKIGDDVIGSNGKPTKVTGVFPQPKQDIFEITFNDGFKIKTDGSHLWSVTSCNYSKTVEGKKNNENLITLSTLQMFEGDVINNEVNGRVYKTETYYKTKRGFNKWSIPIVEPIQFNPIESELPIDPYLLGLCIGDGHINKKSCRFTIHKNDFNELLDPYIKNINVDRRNGHFMGSVFLGDSIVDLGLSNKKSYEKFIPEIYKLSSISDRLSLLQGLMDTDGYCNIGKKEGDFRSTEYSTTSEQLANDVCELVQTLGGIARKSSRKSFYTKNGERVECRTSYRINIKLTNGMNPFRLKRKSDLYFSPKKYPVCRYIKNIEKVGFDETVCISVDADDKLYVVEHGIVTHNTSAAVMASLESKAKKVLIVCPASLKINWKREIEMYDPEKKILIVEGRKWGSTFDYYIINYDIIKNYHSDEDSDEDVKLLVNANFDLAIVDEAHYLSNPSANRTKLLNDVLEKIPKVWLLTGTPMTSRPINYFNLLKIIRSPLTLNWQTYVKRYCNGFQFKVGKKKIWRTSGATNLDELRELTRNNVLRRLKTDILDLPDKLVSPVYLELDNKMYNEELDEFIRITKEQKNSDTLSVQLNRLMPVRKIIANEKIPYTCELIDKCLEQNKKVIILTNFTSTLDQLHERYKKNSVVLDGRMSKDRRQESVDKFQNDDKITVFIGNIKAAGVGITLTAAEVVIMNDLSFVPADHAQGEDRAYRYGQKKSVSVYYPVFENTIEMIIYNILQSKKNVIDQVMGDGEFSDSFAKELLGEIV